MTDIEEIRARFRAGAKPADPPSSKEGSEPLRLEAPVRPSPAAETLLARRAGKVVSGRPRGSGGPSGASRYVIDGDDAILKFGKNQGKRVSDLAGNFEGRGYLRWLLNEDFPADLKKIVQDMLDRMAVAT